MVMVPLSADGLVNADHHVMTAGAGAANVPSFGKAVREEEGSWSLFRISIWLDVPEMSRIDVNCCSN